MANNTSPGAYLQKAGLGNEASYVVSGRPFATGSVNASGGAFRIAFPSVTKFVTIINNDTTALKCGFSENGIDGENHFFLNATSVGDGISTTIDVKVTEMWFDGSSDFSVVAGLTGISAAEIVNNWSGSVGVG
jgi:hypothetical protein